MDITKNKTQTNKQKMDEEAATPAIYYRAYTATPLVFRDCMVYPNGNLGFCQNGCYYVKNVRSRSRVIVEGVDLNVPRLIVSTFKGEPPFESAFPKCLDKSKGYCADNLVWGCRTGARKTERDEPGGNKRAKWGGNTAPRQKTPWTRTCVDTGEVEHIDNILQVPRPGEEGGYYTYEIIVKHMYYNIPLDGYIYDIIEPVSKDGEMWLEYKGVFYSSQGRIKRKHKSTGKFYLINRKRKRDDEEAFKKLFDIHKTQGKVFRFIHRETKNEKTFKSLEKIANFFNISRYSLRKLIKAGVGQVIDNWELVELKVKPK